jgi:hypothetical protein
MPNMKKGVNKNTNNRRLLKVRQNYNTEKDVDNLVLR